jgi:hypothetical protein
VTVEQEMVKAEYSIRNNNGFIFLPNWVRQELLNLHVPSQTELFTQSISQEFPISAKVINHEGIWRYSKAGAAMAAGTQGFLKGNYFQVPGKAGNSVNSGFEGAPYAAVAAEDTMISIADTAAVKNEYEGALLVVYNDTNSDYEQHRIIGNDATNATYTKLYIAPPGFKRALTTAMGITIYRNEYMGIRTLTGGYMSALGYARIPITSAYFFWLFTAGRISGITGASTWPGQTQYYRDVYANTDGSLIGYTAGYQRVGYLLGRTASDYGDNCIMLQLDQ